MTFWNVYGPSCGLNYNSQKRYGEVLTPNTQECENTVFADIISKDEVVLDQGGP